MVRAVFLRVNDRQSFQIVGATAQKQYFVQILSIENGRFFAYNNYNATSFHTNLFATFCIVSWRIAVKKYICSFGNEILQT